MLLCGYEKEVLEKVGLLDESFFMYGEDIDLSYRIQKRGFENWYLGRVKILHYKEKVLTSLALDILKTSMDQCVFL